MTTVLDKELKRQISVEGADYTVALDADGRGGWLVTDPDDAGARAELCRLELGGTW